MTATSLSEPVVALDLTGRTALVTGGGSGIGLACVRRLAAAGARVVVVDRDAAAAHAAVAGIEAEAVVCDLADPEQVDALPDQVDVLVNNAGGNTDFGRPDAGLEQLKANWLANLDVSPAGDRLRSLVCASREV